MRGPHREYEQFLRRVHRRFVLLFVFERAGLGLLFGSGAALPLLLILLWRGLPALSLALASLVLGAAVGLLWGLLNRPGELAAALEADRQLRWADLLSSALTVAKRSPADPWAAAVLELADLQTRSVSPSAVILNRLGARAWGGIGLATALVIVLGLVQAYSSSSRAGESMSSPPDPLVVLESAQNRAESTAPSLHRHTPTQQDPEDANATRMEGAEPPVNAQQDSQPERPDQRRPNSAADASSRGTGQSHSNASQQNGPHTGQSATHSKSFSQGVAAGGAGEGGAARAGSADAAGQSAGASAKPSHAVAPWQTSGWQSDSQHALDALQSGRVPDTYRDVIRGYFEPR